MELMSSLLLCALATLVPQALGENGIIPTTNKSIMTEMAPSIYKNQIPTIKLPTLLNKTSDLQTVFMDTKCKICTSCMERAIKSHKAHNHVDLIDVEKFHNEINRQRNIRDKRKSDGNTQEKVDKTTKNSRPKNNKSVTIIKYNDNERIYALKIMESNRQVLSDRRNTNKTITCQVYSVKKSYPCESPEADLILKQSKRKINNKSKKGHKREKNVPDAKATVIAPVFRKRQIDDSQAPEQIMSSIEEMY